MNELRLTGATSAGGAATITATRPVLGLLFAVEWIDGDLADGVDAVLSVIQTGSAVDQTLLTLTDANADAWYYPRTTEDDPTGTALATYTYPVINGVMQLVIASGGDTKTGGCIVYYIEDI